MELRPNTANAYIRDAFTKMIAVVDRLEDAKVNVKPPGPDTNSAAVLVVHCCGVSEHWLGHVGLGRPSNRDRDAEFRATASVAELHTLIEAALAQAEADVVALDAATASRDHPGGDHPVDVDRSSASLVLHVLEELYQHLGHMELTADALSTTPAEPP
jgi:uncharacterized damage-inducible protein DinB